jgi:hypothetical protein
MTSIAAIQKYNITLGKYTLFTGTAANKTLSLNFALKTL